MSIVAIILLVWLAAGLLGVFAMCRAAGRHDRVVRTAARHARRSRGGMGLAA